MNFNFSEDHLVIRESVERMFIDLCEDETIKKLAKSEQAMHHSLWNQLAESGILGLPFEEQYGGMGLGLVELCLIIELQGRTVSPVPLVSTIVEAGLTIASSGNERMKQKILPRVIEADAIVSPAGPYRGLQDNQVMIFDGKTISGRSGFVPYAGLAQFYVVEARDDQGQPLLFVCEHEAPGLQCITQTAISDEPAGFLLFDNVEVSQEAILASGPKALEIIQQQKNRTYVALAAMQVGALEEGLKRTASYVSERKQFGRALGSFQAVSQQAADAYMELESLRSVYWRALDDIQSGEDFSVSAMVAKYWVSEAGHRAAHTILHLHGGIGQDLDYPIHRYFLFAKQCERYLGGAEEVSAILGKRLMASDSNQLEQICS